MIKGIPIDFATTISKRLNGSTGRSPSAYTFHTQFYNYNSYQWQFDVNCSGRPQETVRDVIEFLRTRNGSIRPFIFIDVSVNQSSLERFDSINENVWRFSDRRHLSISEGDAARIGFDQGSIQHYSYFSVNGQFYQLDQGGFVFAEGAWTAPISSFYREDPTNPVNPQLIWSNPEALVRLQEPFTTTTSQSSDFVQFGFTALEDVN